MTRPGSSPENPLTETIRLIELDSGNRASPRRLFDHYPCLHLSSVAVSREHRRAKTDRLDTELLKRGFLGWLRGERGIAAWRACRRLPKRIAKRPNRERDCLVRERTRIVNRIKSTLAGWAFATSNQPCARRPIVWQPFTPRRACR